jgi:hypothetical protein
LGSVEAVPGTEARPLALFGSSGYASLMGRLAMPTLLAQAVAPTLMAFTLAGSRPEQLVATLASLAFLNVLLSYAIRLVAPRDERTSGEA